MRAFVMAAGRGTRLAPLTDVVPKPLIPIANEPAIVGLLRTCARHGVRDVVINVSYLGDQLINAIGDGSSLGVRVSWSREDEPLGTAGGMKNAEMLLRDGDEPVLVLSGDGLHDIDLSAAAAAHRAAGVKATIVLSPVDDPQEYGVAVRDERGFITAFQEKPSRDEALSHDANTGIYLFAPEVFDRLPAAGTFYDFGSQLFPALMHEGEPVLGVVHQGYWNDIGTHEELRRGTFAVLAGELDQQQLADTTGEPAQAGVLIHSTAEVDDSAVLTAPCVVGPHARVGAGARVARSIVLPGGIVPAGALLAGATYGSVEGLAAWSASLGDTSAHDAPHGVTSGDASS